MTAALPVDEGAPSTSTEPEPDPGGRERSALAAVARRWPTALALALAAASFSGAASADRVGSLAETLLFLPLLYLVVSTLRRPRLTWVVLVAGVAVSGALDALGWVDTTVGLLAAALAATVWGGAHRRFGDGSWFTLQVVGMAAFTAVALVAVAVDPTASRYLVAAGWFAHGVWDFVHLYRRRVVQRSYAEWCGVLDVSVAAQLVLVPLLL